MADKLSKRIRGKLRDFTLVDYLISCCERYKDAAFRDYCRHKSFSTISLENILSNNSDGKIIYYIKSGNSFSGFGAEFRRTLDALFFADHYGFIPYIEYTDQYIYSETEPINGTDNPFEYYFEQTSSISKGEAENRPHVMFLEEHRRLIQNTVEFTSSYELSDEYIELVSGILKKYIRLKKQVSDYIEKSLSGLVDNETIGVHYRGTDFNVGYKRHPNFVTIDDYFSAIDKMLNIAPNASIFIATDEQKAIDMFVNRYGEKIRFFSDVFRSQDGSPIHFSQDGRENHHYKLGLEILRDIVSLSKCEYLVAGLSQVSYCARIFKKSQDQTYAGIEILCKGIK